MFSRATDSLMLILLSGMGIIVFYTAACVPPPPSETYGEEEEVTTAISELECLQLLSSAAEYYKNKDWPSTVRLYKQVVDLGCDKGSEEEVYQFWAIAYEYLGLFDSSEYVLLQGLKRLPDNLSLHNRLAYAYKRLGQTDREIHEYERIIGLAPEDTELMKRLSELYGEAKRYEDQIYILERILELEPNNKNAQGALAQAYKMVGKDPLDLYVRRFEDNPSNLSYGLDLAGQYMTAGRYTDAISVLKRLERTDSGNSAVSKRLVLKKLAQAYSTNNQLEESSQAYERLFEYDPKDFRTALEIVKLNLEIPNFAKALRWSEKAIEIAPENGETYGYKGHVYYRAFQECRKDYPSADDKIVARLAHKYIVKGEELNYRRFRRDRKYLEDNEDDLMFGISDWFLLDEEQKRKGSISPSGECYNWVKESIKKDPSWK